MSNKSKNEGLNQQGNYIYMLIGLLILIIIGPTLSHEIESGAKIITQFMFVSVMLVGVWSLESISRASLVSNWSRTCHNCTYFVDG